MSSSASSSSCPMRHFALFRDYREVTTNAPLDTYLLPDPYKDHIFHGIIQPGQGVWKDIVFKFSIEVPENYTEPNTWPRVRFRNLPIHPLVHTKTGEVNMEHLFEVGNGTAKAPNRNLLGFLVKLKSMLLPEPELLSQIQDEKAWNTDALEKFRNDGIEYFERVRSKIPCMATNVAESKNSADLSEEHLWEPFEAALTRNETRTFMNFLTSDDNPKEIADLANFVSQSVEEREARYGDGNY